MCCKKKSVKMCECGEFEADYSGYCEQCREDMDERDRIIAREEAIKDKRRESWREI